MVQVSVGWGYTFVTNSSTGQPIQWPAGTIAVTILANNAPALSDGLTQATTIQAAMLDATRGWNHFLGTVQFTVQIQLPGAGGVDHNHINEIFFSSSPYNYGWDSNTLAVTTGWSSGNQRTEADIIFNTAFTWDSYRGASRASSASGPYDIQRVALHELGHVLGLDHPDEAGQYVTAIMNSVISNIDSLQPDDINGAQSLYGAPNAAPIILGQPANQTVFTGQNVQFSVSASGSPAPAYRWQRLPVGSGTWGDLTDGGSYSGAGTATLAITSAATAMNGDQFRCVATNTSGTATSNPATLTVSALALPAFTSQPVNVTVTSGQSATFSVAVSGNPVPTLQWQRQAAGSGIWNNLYGDPSDTQSTLILLGTGVRMSGDQFRCVATNSSGSATSNAAILTVNQDVAPVASVAAGNRHTLFVKADGTLWAAGWNAYGQLGDGTTTDRSNPLQIATGVAKVAAGGGISFFIKTDGTLWAMGWNYAGELGDGTTTDRHTPVQIATGVASVSAGGSYAVFVKTDGTLWGMGANNYGSLGDGTTTDRHTPVQIASGVLSASAAAQTLFVKTDGTLWVTGYNGSGQLGDGTTTTRFTPVQVASGVTAVACGGEFSLFLKTDGTLWGMGANNYGQLGDGTTTERHSPVQIATGVARVAAGESHALFVKSDGTLWSMGDNYYGESCMGRSGGSSIIPLQVANDVAAVSGGLAFTAFLKTDGSMWTVGIDTYGNLCDGTPLPYGNDHTSPEEVTGPAQVIVAPTITLQPISQSINIPGNSPYSGWLVLRVWASGSTPFTYQWLKNGAILTGNSSSAYVDSVTLNAAGNYSVIVSNSAGSVTSNVAVLTVQAAPSFTTQPFSQPVTAGNPVTFTATATGALAFTYQWQKDGINISGATGNSYTIPIASAADAGKYTLVATNSAGSTASNIAVLTVQPAGNAYMITTLAGIAGNPGSADGTGSAAQFKYPTGVALDGTGNIYVSDQNNYTIRKITPGGVVTTFAGTAGVSGSTDGTGSAARFLYPTSVAVDGAGNVYVADYCAIRKITPNGAVTTLAGGVGNFGFVDGIGSAARFYGPNGIAVDGAGLVYVSDGCAIRSITAGGVVTTVAGYSNTSGPFGSPFGVAVDGAGNVYVADTYFNQIRKMTPGGFVTVFAGSGSEGWADGTGSIAQFSMPEGVAVDSAGNVYVTIGDSIRKITPNGVVTPLAGFSEGSADGRGTAAQFYGPRGIAVNAGKPGPGGCPCIPPVDVQHLEYILA